MEGLKEASAQVRPTPSESRHLEMLRLAERMAGLGHWHADLAAGTLFWSREIYRIHGLHPDAFQPDIDAAIDFYHPDDKPTVEALVNRAISNGEAFDFEARVVRPDGEVRVVLSRGQVQSDEQGNAVSIFGTFLDITERRQIEEDLRRTHERYTQALIGSGAGLWDWNFKTGELYWSPQFLSMMGVDADAFQPHADEFRTRIHPDDLALVDDAVAAHLERGEPYNVEHRMRRDDGAYIWVEAQGQALCNPDGSITRMAGTVHDITDRKIDEEMRNEIYTLLTNARLAPDDHFRELLNIGRRYLGADIGLISRVHNGQFTIRNMVGGGAHFEPGSAFALADTHCAQVVRQSGVQTRLSDTQPEGPLTCPLDAPTYIGVPLLVRGRPFGTLSFLGGRLRRRPFDSREESFVAMLAQWVANEIAQFRARDQIMASREVLRQQSVELDLIFNLVPSSIWFMDDELRVLRVNEQAAAVTGLPSDEIIGRSIYELMPSIQERYADELDEIMRSGNAIIGKLEDSRPVDGKKTWVRIDKVPFDDPVSKRRCLITVATDITAMIESRESLEEYASLLERSNRDLDDFAYVASHDLRAPMRGIENLARWLEEDLQPTAGADTMEKLSMMRRRIQRMDDMLSDMLAYSRAGRGELVPEAVDCQDVFDEVIEWVQDRFDHDIEITSRLPVISAPRTTIQQIFLNLVSNAAKHHDKPSGGQIRIHCQAQLDQYCFSVIDDGPGIPVQYRERIFRMFETLKRRDEVEGNGMGLAIVERLVNSVGGRILVREGSSGRGSEFRVYLPAGTTTEAA